MVLYDKKRPKCNTSKLYNISKTNIWLIITLEEIYPTVLHAHTVNSVPKFRKQRWRQQMGRQIVNHTVCPCVHGCCLFLIHTFKFCQSTCCCSVVSSPDKHGGNQCLDIFLKRREGGSLRIEREEMTEREEWFILFIWFFFSLSFRSLCPWQKRICEREVDEKDGDGREGL